MARGADAACVSGSHEADAITAARALAQKRHMVQRRPTAAMGAMLFA